MHISYILVETVVIETTHRTCKIQSPALEHVPPIIYHLYLNSVNIKFLNSLKLYKIL